jgi:DNA adenine methylase
MGRRETVAGPASASLRIVKLYTELGYTVQFLEAPRMISCTGMRRPAREVFATRNL